YTAEKLRRGSFSSLLGLRFDPVGARWSALALGDSCLFHIRRRRLVKAFPISSPTTFGNNPVLVASLPHAPSRDLCAQTTDQGSILSGDHFILATDALAAWFLRRLEERRRRQHLPWTSLLEHGVDRKRFERFVNARRKEGSLRNDDIALAIIRID